MKIMSGTLSETEFTPEKNPTPNETGTPESAILGDQPFNNNPENLSQPTDEPPDAIQTRRIALMNEIKEEIETQNRNEDRLTSVIRTNDQLSTCFQNRGMIDSAEVRRVATSLKLDSAPIRGGWAFALFEKVGD